MQIDMNNQGWDIKALRAELSRDQVALVLTIATMASDLGMTPDQLLKTITVMAEYMKAVAAEYEKRQEGIRNS